MYTIDLAYVGRGLHEELVAYIADQQDYYADEGVHVALRDGCDWDEERLRHGATIGLGRTLLSRLTSYETFIAPYFIADGQADLAVGATAITAVAAELGVPATVTAAEFYRTVTSAPTP